MAEVEYISKEVFNIQLKSINERLGADEKLSDLRLDYMRDMLSEQFNRLEAVVEKNLAKHESIASGGKKDIDNLQNDIREIKNYVASLETGYAEIKGDVKAINARFDTLQNKFSWNLAWVGIIMGLVLAIVQHFWK